MRFYKHKNLVIYSVTRFFYSNTPAFNLNSYLSYFSAK